MQRLRASVDGLGASAPARRDLPLHALRPAAHAPARAGLSWPPYAWAISEVSALPGVLTRRSSGFIEETYLTVNVPCMPAWRWPGTEQ